jgi:hypothetical protein
MLFLCLSLLFQPTVHRRATRANQVEGTTLAKLAASLSLACWQAVALAGRAITYP